MEIIIVRHGESEANKAGVTGGDPDLTAEGRIQAQELARRLGELEIDAIYCSPLKRTSQTAQPLADRLNKPIIVDARIREVDWGDFDGKEEEHFIKTIGQHPRDSLDSYTYDFRRYNGESASDVEERVKSFIVDLRTQPYQLVLVVCHGGIVRWLNYLITGEKISWQPNAEELYLKSKD